MTLAGIVFAGSSFAAVMQPTALKNFQEVEASLYRGAQPSEEGFRELAKLGVHTVGAETRNPWSTVRRTV